MNFDNWILSTEYLDDQILQCGPNPDDDIWLAKRAGWCDRGRFVSTLGVHGSLGKMLSLFGLSQGYYFDDEYAKLEIAGFLKLGAELVESGKMDKFLKSSPSIGDNLWSIRGISCEISLHFMLFPDFSNIKAIVALLHVDNDAEEKGLYVDEQDGWPRYYLDINIAKAEAIAWLSRRNQYISTPPC